MNAKFSKSLLLSLSLCLVGLAATKLIHKPEKPSRDAISDPSAKETDFSKIIENLQKPAPTLDSAARADFSFHTGKVQNTPDISLESEAQQICRVANAAHLAGVTFRDKQDLKTILSTLSSGARGGKGFEDCQFSHPMPSAEKMAKLEPLIRPAESGRLLLGIERQ
jgi:hypothetical protein